MASMEILVMVGRIIMAKIIEAAKRDKPGPPRYSRMIGTNKMTPKNPDTTEGMPAKSSIVGFKKTSKRGGQNSARVTAQARAKGTPITMDPKVTAREEIIMAKIPKWPLVGAHLALNRKSFIPAFKMTGSPSLKMKTVMSKRTQIAENAKRERIFSMILC